MMKSKIRVRGKSQSRTALGIINAYLKLHPDATLSELQHVFPKSLNHKSYTDNIIVPVEETLGHEKMFFEHEDELIVLKNGEKLALVEIWSKDDFVAICEHVKQYGIEIAEEDTRPFEKGSFDLEYLDGFVHPAEIQGNDGKKKCKFNWWWILLLLLLLLIIFFCCKKCCCSDKCCSSDIGVAEEIIPVVSVTSNDEKKINNSVSDTGDAISFTLPDGNEWKIMKNTPEFKLFTFLNSPDDQANADQAKGWITLDKVHFDTGKAKLAPESENQLKNITMIMKFFPNARIRIGGYTDNTGTDELNRTISSERAKVTAEKLISSGIAANRVTYEGYGSQRPVCPGNDSETCRAANRRVDISATHK